MRPHRRRGAAQALPAPHKMPVIGNRVDDSGTCGTCGRQSRALNCAPRRAASRLSWALRLSRTVQAHVSWADRPSAVPLPRAPPRCHILLHRSGPSASRFSPEGYHRFEMTGAGSRPVQIKEHANRHMPRQRQHHGQAPRADQALRRVENVAIEKRLIKQRSRSQALSQECVRSRS